MSSKKKVQKKKPVQKMQRNTQPAKSKGGMFSKLKKMITGK